MTNSVEEELYLLQMQTMMIMFCEDDERPSSRTYMRPIFSRRRRHSDFYHLVRELELSDADYFGKYARFSPALLEEVLQMVGPLIKHGQTHRIPIGPKERLMMTIRFLASGDSQSSISFAYRVGRATVCKVVSETCRALWESLGPIYVPVPTEEDWLDIARDFFKFWNFPNCVGALDGKHVVMQAPYKVGSEFYNYKGTHSIVLMALVDARYKFTLFDVGSSGRHSDGGVLAHSAFGQVMERKGMNFPKPSYLPGSHTKLPHVIVGDEAFPLREDLMRPYPGRNLPEDKNIFNYRLSRARRVVENTFGILVARWRIFRRPIISKPENVNAIVMATICLHNFMRRSDIGRQPTQRYCPPGYTDYDSDNGNITKGQWRGEIDENSSLNRLGRVGSNNYGTCAVTIREDFATYFNSNVGALPWQIGHVRRGQEPDNN